LPCECPSPVKQIPIRRNSGEREEPVKISSKKTQLSVAVHWRNHTELADKPLRLLHQKRLQLRQDPPIRWP
ncbi:hypothetical protein U1Q18_031658, partial [Sarracenia purpurea var. burkii]